MGFEERTWEGKKRAKRIAECRHEQMEEMMAFGVKTVLTCKKCPLMMEELV